MNNKILKTAKISIPALLLIFLSGCLKTHDGFIDFTKTSDFVILQNAGLANFSSVAFNRGSDTVNLTVRVDLASATNPSSSTTVSIALDPSLIAPYNSANPQPGYLVLPAANYKLLANSLTIPAGQHYAETTLQVYTKGLDPVLSYMLPVSITDASGKALSSNLNTIYFHTVGNPLAGVYTFTGKRWNAPNLDTSTAPSSTPYNNVSISISPLGPTTLYMPDAYLSQNSVAAGTALSFTNNAGVLSNFQASLYDPAPSAIAAVGFSVITGPVLVGSQIVGDASTKYVGSTFRIYYVFFNGSAQRAIIDNFVKTQ